MKVGIISCLLLLIINPQPIYAVNNDELKHIDYSQLGFKKLKLKKTKRFEFDESSKQLTFLDQSRNYLAFKLPDNIYYTLDLELNVDGYFSKTRSLFPKMIALDESFNVVDNNIAEGFNLYFDPSTFGRGSFKTKQRMSPKARYVIIFADNNSENKFYMTSEAAPQVMMMGNTPVLLHNHEKVTSTINIIENGKFKLKFAPLFR